ncbi:MAG: (d)CMP kinase [Chloroflexia bacterium]
MSEDPDNATPDQQPPPRSIAIDGPAGAGKSTIGRLLAEHLHYLFLDTGAMYRAVALAALGRGIDATNEPLLADLADHLPIHIEKPRKGETDGRPYTVLLGDRDVTWDIRRPEVESVVSVIASWPSVRTSMVGQQRRMAQLGPVVMVGRDITTEVLPDADLKIYLDASLQERAKRRHDELLRRGRDVTFEQVESEIAHRDDLDMHRSAGALRMAEDAVQVKTDGLEIEQSLAKIMGIVRSWRGPNPAGKPEQRG